MTGPAVTLAPDLHVYSLVGEATSHLLVRHGRSLLIDCHSGQLTRWLERRQLPVPEMMVHTHVQPQHCREADQFPAARLLVHAQLLELAADPAGYTRATRTTWENPASWMDTLGREPYGIAGCVTVFPPATPLKPTGTFREGDRIAWQDLVLEVIPLPGHSRAHVGFVLELAGRPLAIFSGDLLCNPSRLVNIFDLESNYSRVDFNAVATVLRELAQRPVRLYFPATGPVLTDGPDQALALVEAIQSYEVALAWQSGVFQPAPQAEGPRVGRYQRLHKGVYQMATFGNCILLIDDQGRGLMCDPGPCDFESTDRLADFHRDLDVFERECGLKAIDQVLVTHIHGDHYDMVPELQRRYPACRVAALDRVAQVLEAPWDYAYAALLPWYGLGFDHVTVDDVLTEDAPFAWHDTSIRPVHLPGHCYCHAGYLLTFNGLRLAFTGDTIQSRGEAGGVDFLICNYSIPDARSGIVKAYRRMAAETVDLNLGGHGSHFRDCAALYAESLRRIEHALPFLCRLVRDENLEAAFVRRLCPPGAIRHA
ncbi:MAG: MBL fold metallo-hydrolase [Lentisphaerae bacterium]|nr:MBL fold metallo-hydrolase [Lentisphaerota bacterium]